MQPALYLTEWYIFYLNILIQDITISWAVLQCGPSIRTHTCVCVQIRKISYDNKWEQQQNTTKFYSNFVSFCCRYIIWYVWLIKIYFSALIMMILIVIPLWALHINMGELLVAIGQDPIVAKWVTDMSSFFYVVSNIFWLICSIHCTLQQTTHFIKWLIIKERSSVIYFVAPPTIHRSYSHWNPIALNPYIPH